MIAMSSDFKQDKNPQNTESIVVNLDIATRLSYKLDLDSCPTYKLIQRI